MEKSLPQDPIKLPDLGAILELELKDLSSRGQGVGRTADGLVVMVTGGLPGEQVSARVVRLHRNRVDAEVEQILRPAPERSDPQCVHFGSCGGCSLQILDPAARFSFLRLERGRFRGAPCQLTF